MPRPISKAQLVSETLEEYEALEKFIAALTPPEMIQPGALGDWSVKDVLAHLLEWQQMFFSWYQAGLRGEVPAIPAEGYKWNQLADLNQAIFLKHQDSDLGEIVSQFKVSHQKILDLIQSLPEDVLFQPGCYAWMKTGNLAGFISANTGNHYHWAYTEMRKQAKKRKKLQA